MGENSTFFKELIGLNGSDISQFMSEDSEESNESQMQCQNMTHNITTTSDIKDINDSNFSFQLISDHEMDVNLTPSLEMRANVSKRRNLFAFHNKKQLFENNFCVNNRISEEKEDIEVKDQKWNNTLGLSPVKTNWINDNISSISKSLLSVSHFQSNDLQEFNGLQVNGFSPNGPQLDTESLFNGESFRSLSKCSDLELRPEEPKVDINQTFLSPNSEFDHKSITTYFKQRSEPLSSADSTDSSIALKTSLRNSVSPLDESFVSVLNEIDSSNNTLETAQKLINRKNRKRKSDSSISLSSTQDIEIEKSFTPSVNSTLNSDDITDKESPNSQQSRSVGTSGLGTLTTVGQTYSMPNSSSTQSIGLGTGSALSLNQLLVVSPNMLSLTIGCFVDFKLNYLKVRNLSITSFKADFKLQTDADTLNSLQIEFPKQSVTIPTFYDGLLTDQITITPLKSGYFSLSFQIYFFIDGINLPISPTSVICHIRVEELVVKRPLYSSHSMEYNYHLFEDNMKPQTIDLFVSNRQIINEIPLKMCLDSNKCIVFEPIHRHPESAIHTFRCSDPNTLFLVTKSQYEMRIPIRIQSYGVRQTESCLVISTDSLKSHILAMFRLRATFWPKRELSDKLSLQCSQTSICLKTNEWKDIHFRNKSKENVIRISLKCKRNERPDNSIKLSASHLMVPPLQKVSIALLREQNTDLIHDMRAHLSVTYDSGFGKSFKIEIPITSSE